jgi:hypothetical protein
VKLTPEKLGAMSVAERHQLWRNARVSNHPDAKKLLEMLEQSGLPYADNKVVGLTDPVALKMYDIINSEEARVAMIQATEAGWPALAGVDPMLNHALGVDYGKHNMTTNTAGEFVTERMRALGYTKGNQRPMPPGCVARSAVMFVKK